MADGTTAHYAEKVGDTQQYAIKQRNQTKPKALESERTDKFKPFDIIATSMYLNVWIIIY